MAYDPDNVFAKIIRGEIPCDKVYENDYALAFRDINPQRPVHVLILPKGSYADLNDFCANAAAEEISTNMSNVCAARRDALTYRL